MAGIQDQHSPDPKIKITTTGGAPSVTFQFVGVSEGLPSGWKFKTDGDFQNWTAMTPPVNVTTTATVVVEDATRSFTHADLYRQQNATVSLERQALTGTGPETTTFTLSNVSADEEFGVVLDNVDVGALLPPPPPSPPSVQFQTLPFTINVTGNDTQTATFPGGTVTSASACIQSLSVASNDTNTIRNFVVTVTPTVVAPNQVSVEVQASTRGTGNNTGVTTATVLVIANVQPSS